MLRKLRVFLAPLFIVITLVIFGYFLKHHPEVWWTLHSTNKWVLLLIGGLYLIFMASLSEVYSATLKICGKTLPRSESILLTCYSTVVNFFGPLQSGPAIRAAYLKQKHGVRLQDYTLATCMYYAIYAVLSAMFILIGSGSLWPFALMLVAGVAIVSAMVITVVRRRLERSNNESSLVLRPILLLRLLIATAVQLSVQFVIYIVELQTVQAQASALHVAAYSGSANFALFVSLTPGAIGFREAFLEFSRRVHHISSAHIVAANVIDRTMFVVILGVLFVIIVSLHANRRLAAKVS